MGVGARLQDGYSAGSFKVEAVVARSKSARLTAKLKAKKAKERLRKAGRLTKKRAGGRLTKVARKA